MEQDYFCPPHVEGRAASKTPNPKGEATITHTPDTAPRWWNTLAFRLAVVINTAAILVLGAFAEIDSRREEAAHMQPEIDRLREEARVLRVAWDQLPDSEQFQAFLDQFCRQMSSAASPGHHIAVFDKEGEIATRAHEHANHALEVRMATSRIADAARFAHDGEPFVSVSVITGDGSMIAVAQSLAPVEQILHAQRISRLASTAILVALIFGVTTVALLVWVRDPLRELVSAVSAVGKRRFDVRVRPSGSRELRYLTHGVNEMIQALEVVEKNRESEMRRAQEIQQALLPHDNRHVDGFDVATVFLPAERIGGDLYDIVNLSDGSTLLAVFDVSGHGVPAALFTALLRTVVRHHAAQNTDLALIAGAMNLALVEVAPSGTFATCLLVRLLPSEGAAEYVSAGHDPAIIVTPGGPPTSLRDGGLVLGVERCVRYKVSRVEVSRGSRIFIFTDGIHEASDDQARLFGRERLTRLLAETNGLSPEQQLNAVVQSAQRFQGHDRFDDDVTLLCAYRK